MYLTSKRPSAGFSLLEMVVAISILALSLGTLYQAASSATRNVSIDEKYAYAVELARSLLAENGMVPDSGVKAAGKTENGFSWTVNTSPIDFEGTSLADALLFEIEVEVSWLDGSKRRELVLNSVVEGAVP
jgi:general secretion pathway protein I